MSLDWHGVSVWYGNEDIHEGAAVTVIKDPSAMFVWDEFGTTVYTEVVNLGTNRFLVTSPKGKRIALRIGASGGCGCQ